MLIEKHQGQAFRKAEGEQLARRGKSRVIVVHASDVSDGGVVNATLFYAIALSAAGYPAEIWTASKALAARAEDLGVPTFYHYWLKNAGVALFNPAIVARALASRKNAEAIIHQGEKLWLFGRVWFHGIDESVVFHNDKIKQRRFFSRWLALSDGHRAELESFKDRHGYNRTIKTIRNGPLLNPSRKFFASRSGRIAKIGCLGNFGGKKAVEVLVKAFADIVGRGHDIRLVLAGDGQQRSNCQALAKELGVADRIDWPGWLTDTTPFFDEIDLFCLPSRNEPFGIVVTEAMLAGLPVIATSTKGPSEIVVPGETGWLVPPDDATSLANAIEDAIFNPDKTAAYGRAGYNRYEEDYSPYAVGEILADALDLKSSSLLTATEAVQERLSLAV